VTNRGIGTLNVVGDIAEADPGFAFVSGAAFSLGAGQSRNVIVSFGPTVVGAAAANFAFTSNGGNATVQASGTGVVGPTVVADAQIGVLAATVTVTVSNGPANSTDWVAMIPADGSPTSLDWKYLNGQQGPPPTGTSSATLTFTLPATPGQVKFRFFRNNTGQALSTSQRVQVVPAGGGPGGP
jgi:hypothetical protein